MDRLPFTSFIIVNYPKSKLYYFLHESTDEKVDYKVTLTLFLV